MEPEIKIRGRLNANEKQNVTYCVPLWLRDEQVKLNTARVSERIGPHPEKRSDPIGIACYGPSLNDTWEKLRDFKFVMSCSGAHKFLVQRGITPTWHIEVDPRAHKVELIGDPQRGVEYLIASTCHPAVLDHLKGYNVKLWHVFDTKEEGQRILPPGEWALTGGCGVGLRAFTIARFLGFTDLHVFGMDGSEGPTGKHAAEHPNQPQERFAVEYGGTEYFTTPAMLEAARTTWHELDQMPDVKVTFHGDGLVQAMAKNYQPKYIEKERAIIAVNKPELISAEYRELNSKLHYDNLAYGVGGNRHAQTVLKLSETIHTQSILDYGCGKGYLAKALPFPIWEYDPAIPGKQESPRPADIVVCTDVLEHIEPDKLLYVLDDLRRCTKQVGYFTIDLKPSTKFYADGRNTHLIQKDESWWAHKLRKFFQIGKITKVGRQLHVVVGPKAGKQMIEGMKAA